jgi:DNA-binding MarR family transcriptional regulator
VTRYGSEDSKVLMADLECAATTMRKASRRVTQFYDEALAPSGLRSTQYSILAELNRRSASPPTLGELAAALVLDRSTLGHNLRPLERHGLVTLKPADKDARLRHILLSRKGTTKFRSAYPLWRTAQDRFTSVFGRSKTAELRKVLLAIAHDQRLKTSARSYSD